MNQFGDCGSFDSDQIQLYQIVQHALCINQICPFVFLTYMKYGVIYTGIKLECSSKKTGFTFTACFWKAKAKFNA